MFTGAFTAMITPFTDGRVDQARLGEQIAFQIKNGIDGVVPAGTTGESPTLSLDEHERLIAATVQAARGRAKVIAGTGGNSTEEALHLHRFAKERGADASLSVTPYYNKPSQEGLYRHYMRLADAVELPIVLYNVPGRTSVNLLAPTVARLAEHPNIVAIKEASGSIDAASEIRSLCGITILSGDDSLTLPMMAIGAKGVVSVLSNLLPNDVKRLTQMAMRGNFTEAATLHQQLFPLVRPLFADGNPAGVKCAMKLLGRDSGEMRLPLCEVNEPTRVAIEQQLERLALKRDMTRLCVSIFVDTLPSGERANCMTRLCVSIFVETAEQAKRDIAAAAEAGADMVELRIDLVGEDQPLIERIVCECILPCILTCRPDSEGGQSKLDDSTRSSLLACAHSQSTNFVDIELQSVRHDQRNPTFIPEQTIVSSHDFVARPDKLYSLIEEMNALPSAVNKFAWYARTVRDNIEAFELLLHRQKPTIALCMGEAGLLSRVLAKKFGAFLTYVSLRPTEITAPGQPTIEQMKRLYRWDAIDSNTRVYGVVGAPLAHSLSPAVHNAALAAIGENAVYLPMLVNPGYESFKAFMEEFLAFKPLDLRGLSITMPHKENALRYLREKNADVEAIAQEAGAVNTIALRDSVLHGFNTDYPAIIHTLRGALGERDIADLRVAVIGAGGTARTAVAGLARLGATVVIYNRTREKADALAREFDGQSGKVVAAGLEKLCDSCCHVFINATPVGMSPDIDASPLGERLPQFTPETLVFDTIYAPPETKLIRQAKAAGAKTVNGMELFLSQAARQFEIWTGKSASVEAMRRSFSPEGRGD